jgi:predicted transcriptional regulator
VKHLESFRKFHCFTSAITAVIYHKAKNFQMTPSEKAKVKTLMTSRRGLVREACAAAGVPTDTYYNIMRGASGNVEALNKIIEKAKELKDAKVSVSI